MDRSPGELKRMMAGFQSAIRAAGVKLTPQRLEIFRETARTVDHPHLETIYRGVRGRMPGVSLDTVYRTLDLLRELGLVKTVMPMSGRLRFDANTSAHHHFVCTRCGATRDFEHRDFDKLRIPRAAAALGRAESAHVEVRGLCRACSAGAGRRPKTGTRSRRHKTITSKEGSTCPAQRKR